LFDLVGTTLISLRYQRSEKERHVLRGCVALRAVIRSSHLISSEIDPINRCSLIADRFEPGWEIALLYLVRLWIQHHHFFKALYLLRKAPCSVSKQSNKFVIFFGTVGTEQKGIQTCWQWQFVYAV